MAQPRYYRLLALVWMIENPNRSAILKFIQSNWKVLRTAYGSTHNHQAWEGGWWDHITEVMNLAVVLYPVLNGLRPLPFTLSDALLVLFMHDIEKPWKYEWKDGIRVHRAGMETKADHQRFRMQVAKAWDITLTDEHVNGIKYAEGELDDYTPHQRIASPLAAFAHMCDHWSARGLHDCPREQGDPWDGAHRIASRPYGPFEEAFLTRFEWNVGTMVTDIIAAYKEDKPPVSPAIRRARAEESPPGDCAVGCGCGFCN